MRKHHTFLSGLGVSLLSASDTGTTTHATTATHPHDTIDSALGTARRAAAALSIQSS